MEQNALNQEPAAALATQQDWRDAVRSIIEEVVSVERQRSEPAYKTELVEEKRRREQLECRVNELVEENQRSRQLAEESERSAQIRAELQRLGVAKIDLAYRIVKDDVQRAADGSLVARTAEGERAMRDYLASFVQENPEFLPARIAGGSGVSSPQRNAAPTHPVDLERIRPGMSQEELQRVREQISQVALQSLRGE